MPEIAMTTSAKYWSLHTAALMDIAAREIFEDPDVATHDTRVHRGIGENGVPRHTLELYSTAGLDAEAPLGTTVVKSAAGWEVLTDDEARERNIPVPTTPAS